MTKSKEKTRRRRGGKGDKETEGSSKSGRAGHSSLLIQFTEEAPTWYKLAADISERNATFATHPSEKPLKNDIVEKYRSEADEIYRQEVKLFNSRANDKDASWMHSTMSKGTLKDRVAAMSVTVSTDPVHRFYAIDGLLQMAGCLSAQGTAPNSRVAQLAGEALMDLFLTTFLPKNRKLVTLAQRPLHLYENDNTKDKQTTKKSLSPRVLLLWRFEEMVREKYHLFIKKYFGYMLREGNDLQKIPAVRAASELLKSVPEGEATLLSLIVNKLGDPTRKVASAAGHALRVVLQHHPAMQIVIAREVQQLAHRPHLSDRALYNCITFLNQLSLRQESEDQPVQERLPSSLVQTYFRLFEVAVRVDAKTKRVEEAVAMKGRLLSALLTGVNRAHPYLAKSLGELEEHVNSLYRVVHKSPPSACTQALLLLFHLTVGTMLDGEQKSSSIPSDVEKSRQKRFYLALYSKVAQPAIVGTGKHLTLFYNLLYKAMKYDSDKSRVLAFAKRILCTTIHCSSAVLSASLFLLNEIGKSHPEVLHCYNEVLEGKDALRSFDMREQDPSKAIKLPSSGEESGQSDTRLAPAWEMCLAVHHYHPTVQAFAHKFGEIDYKGDPLRDFTLVTFLDKFAYRNPKSSEKVAGKFSRGNSVAERRSGNERRIEGQFALPFNDPAFLHQQKVDAEDQFLHQYFVERAKRDELKGIARKTTDDDDDDDEESGDEDDALDAAEANVSDFGKFEEKWESDEEEDAFVDSLAQKIIEDSIEANELGPDDLDDEDPDMDGWDDMYADDKEYNENDDSEDEAEVKDGVEFLGSDSDSAEGGLQFDDDSDSSSNGGEENESSRKQPKSKVEVDEDAFMDDSEDESDVEEPGEDPINPLFDEDDDDMDWFEEDEDESSEEEHEDTEKKGKKGKTKTLKELPTFASFEDYEDKINQSWKEMKRPAVDEDNCDEAAEKAPVTSKKKRRKR
eukprot:scaffold15653_cov143-Amphora_coffeaeformis.AAC.5